MKQKRISIFILLISIICLECSLQAQDSTKFDGHKWEAPYHLPLPEKWTYERFLIPISFALKIPYSGVEDIRFAPGWANKESDEYWSYSFLWWLDSTVYMNAEIVAKHLKSYYTGLMNVNIDAAKHNLQENQLIAGTAFNKTGTAAGDQQTFIGVVEMLDYMQVKPIKLNCIVHIKECLAENKTAVFFELSKQSFDHSIWKEMQEIRNGFKCKK